MQRLALQHLSDAELDILAEVIGQGFGGHREFTCLNLQVRDGARNGPGTHGLRARVAVLKSDGNY